MTFLYNITDAAADELEARDNMRAFAATLPLIEDCNFGASYDDHGDVLMTQCETIRNGRRYEGWGGDDAAAYGRMIGEVVEREG